MAQSRWDKVGALIQEAREVPPEERSAFLEERCEKEDLREEVASVLAACEEASGFFEDIADSVVVPMLSELQAEAGGDGQRVSDPLDLEGTRVGRYEVEEHLGGGGMGVVYRARDPELGRLVALKFLPPHLAAHSEAEKRFTREAKAAAGLDHPGIATIHEIGQAEDGNAQGQRFIAMTYYEGETLKEKLGREGSLPVKEALGYAEQIAEGLARAHEAGIVHRDVKPANVMVTEEGAVKIVDFGLAWARGQSRLTEPGRRVGTAAYMSPEQAEGEEVGAQTDVWALGVVLYEMLAGKRPFEGGRDTAVVHAILHEEPTPLSDHREEVPSGLAATVERCLAKDRERRYPSAEALLEDLRALGSDAATVSPETRAAHAGTDLAYRRWALGAAAALALVLAVGWALWPGGEAPEADGSASATTGPSPARSIAVLPFEPVGRSEPGPFANGLHGDLITRLSGVSGLQVIAEPSVERYRDSDLALAAIADTLGAGWIMRGSVQEAGGQVRVNAQLIDPRAETTAWAEQYQQKLTTENLFAIQGEITQEIAGALQVELTAGEQERISEAPTEDLQAYRLYVKGRRQLARRTLGSSDHVRQALRYFKRAIDRDSSFALAWAGLADARAFYPQFKPDSLEAPAVKQKRAARRALKLDPNLAEAHASMGLVHQRNLNAPAALRAFKRAIDLKPSYWAAHHWLGELFLHIGRAQKALDHLKLALELNPNLALGRHWLYDAYRATGQFKKSLRTARQQQRMGLEREVAVMGEVRALFILGRFEDARRLAQKHVTGLGTETIGGRWLRAYLIQILAAQEDTTRARKYLDQLQAAAVPPRFLAWAEAGLGNTDRALEHYDRIDGTGWGHIGAVDGLFSLGGLYKGGLQGSSGKPSAIRDDPRYQKLLQEAYRAWGLNPDGSIPEDAEMPTVSQSDV